MRKFIEAYDGLLVIISVVAVIVVGFGVLIYGLSTVDQKRTDACEARGWERAGVRTTLCIDEDGYARSPDSP